MSDANPFSAYLQLADKVFKREVKLNALSTFITTLPPLDRELLERLAEESEKASLNQPRMSWAICCVAEKACRQQKLDLFTRSLAAWYLGRAANRWVQPQKIAKAIARARHGFVKLGDTGWVAACDWMANDLPWTRPNYIESETKLTSSLQVLEENGLIEFAAHCRLALSYNQILINRFVEAETNIAKCETWYAAKGDQLNQARCWRNKAEALRRQQKYETAKKWAFRAKKLFIYFNSKSDIAITWNLLGWIDLFSTTDINTTLSLFEKAKECFIVLDLKLWVAFVNCSIGLVYMQDGQFKFSLPYYLTAKKYFSKHNILSWLADTCLSLGNLYLLQGNLEKGILEYEQAKELHTSIGMKLYAKIDEMGIAKIYAHNGRYQQAVKILEKAIIGIDEFHNSLRTGIGELLLSQIWMSLNNYTYAQNYAESARKHLQVTNQLDSTLAINLIIAKIKFYKKELNNCQRLLEDTLLIARNSNLLLHELSSMQMLGEFYLWKKDYSQAKPLLERSFHGFSKLKQRFNQGYCLTLLGDLFSQTGFVNKSKKYYERALQISCGNYLEVDWRAYGGLAVLHDQDVALDYYHKAIYAINTIRENIWQPEMAGGYLQEPEQIIEKAIRLALNGNYPEELLFFIEANKSISLNQQLLHRKNKSTENKYSKELEDIKSEINWIEQQLQNNSIFNTILENKRKQLLQNRLLEKIRYCNELLKKRDRENTNIVTSYETQYFSLENLRQNFTQRCGEKWVVLDLYQLDNQIICIFFTRDEIHTFVIPNNYRQQKALFVCLQSHRHNVIPSNDDLRVLGKHLVPKKLQEFLSPETILCIVPHNILHGIPWAAIGTPPLVTQCIPVIIPSLRSLSMILENNLIHESSGSQNVLFIGVSIFNGRFPDLPYVEDEINLFKKFNNFDSILIHKNLSHFKDIQELFKNNEYGKYDSLHLATHFFSNPETGRLSGFALKDENIWIDQLRDISPLPRLVTFSGCNSIFGELFAGDEQLNLPNTCFLAGAENVIGSVWSVVDQSTSKFMERFYSHYLLNKNPALSLSLTQRELIIIDADFRSWAGYCCMGIP